MEVPIKYIPKKLSEKDKKKQSKQLKKSRKLYKKGIYHTRKNVSSFKSKKSNHVRNAERIYNIDSLKSKNALRKILKKGQGAYYSSGSRPNQTAHSWGYARLASAITSGKAAAVDFKILKNGCKKNSKALRLAKKAKNKHNFGTRKVPKTKIK